MQREFLSRLAERLGEDGRVYFRTDYVPYFESVRDELGEHPQLMSVDEPWRFEFPTVFQNRAEVYHSLVARKRQPRA